MTRRHADYSQFIERLTPGEVAVLWFRRAVSFGVEIHKHHPDFPQPAPDGLYLRRDVSAWFDSYHGHVQASRQTAKQAEDEALRIARFGRGQRSASAA